MAKKVWTAAARKAFAAKMKAARLAKGGRRRRKNPTKEQVKAAAKSIAKKAAALAWRGAKAAGRTTARAGKAAARSAAADVKASICRTRATNPKRRHRRRNPASGFVIVARPRNLGGAENSLVWDGKKFSRNASPVIYPTRQAAVNAGQDLYQLRKIKRSWRAWVGDVQGSYLSA